MKRNKSDEARPEGVTPDAETESGRTSLDAPVQSAIGRELRAMYDEVVCEPVPDRFMRLLEQLDQNAGALDAKGGRSTE